MTHQPNETVRFEIAHTSHYAYSGSVFLEPHTIRLEPRACGYQTVDHHELSITPHPVGTSRCLDAEGNIVTIAWFDRTHEELTVTVHSRVSTGRSNPFDYFLPRAEGMLPMTYPEPLAPLLAPARRRAPEPPPGDPIGAFAAELCRETGDRVVEFLSAVNETIYERCEVIRREDGDPYAPGETWQGRRGACRDLAVLFIDACRAVGLAARFVSGYQEGDPDQTRSRDLHAWAEVHVPGGGWRGYDPTHGLAVADGHIAIAAAVRSEDAAPISGSFRGTAVRSRLETHVDIRVDRTVQAQVRE